MEVGLSPGDFVLDGDPATNPKICKGLSRIRPENNSISMIEVRYKRSHS